MKILYLISLLMLPVIFLSSCSIDWNNENDTKTTNQDKNISDDIFKKKQECAKYKDDMLKESISFHNEWMTRTWDAYDLSIDEIFYSKSYNSCIYELSISKTIDIWEWLQKILLNKYLYDYLSKKEIITTVHSNNEVSSVIEEAYLKKLRELKWE